MKLRLLFSVMLMLAFNLVQAAYFKNVPRIVTQPNGDSLHCFVSGDEFHHWLHDSNGYTIVQNPATGYYVYATVFNDTLQPTAHIAGKVNPIVIGLTSELNISAKQWTEKRKRMEDEMFVNNNSKTTKNGSNKNRGVINNLVVFIRFADDTEFTSSYSSLDAMLNDSTAGANSMYNYFKSTSYNQLQIFSTFYPTSNDNTILSYQDIYPRSHYEAYSVTNPNGYQSYSERTEREHMLLVNAINAISSQVSPSLNIDYDDNGTIDNVCFVVKGRVGDWSDLLWPHRWTLFSETVWIGDKYVWDYNFQLEDPVYLNNSTMCHEMFHTLSAPDLYHYNDNYKNVVPIGKWDLMAQNTPVPQHSGGYMKYLYGNWVDSIPEITTYGTYTLYPMSSPTPDKVCYKIASENPNEYFVLEYRKASRSFESDLPGSGILIYRINDLFRGRGNASYDGSNTLDEVYIYRPDGTLQRNGRLSSAMFSSNQQKTDFNRQTNPKPFLSDGSISNFLITNITNTRDSIQFTYGTPFLSINTDTVYMPNSIVDTRSIELNTNIYWHISSLPLWLNVSDTVGVNNSTVTFSIIEKNKEQEARSCVVQVTADGVDTLSIVVIQAGNIGITSVENEEEKIVIYPNPANDVLNIIFDSKGKSYSVNLINLMGQKVLTKEICNLKQSQITISGLKAGVYYLQVIADKKVFSEKVIISQ